jgi:hypothetical protein
VNDARMIERNKEIGYQAAAAAREIPFMGQERLILRERRLTDAAEGKGSVTESTIGY